MTASVERASKTGPSAYTMAMTDPSVPHVWRYVAERMLADGVRVGEVRKAILLHSALQPDCDVESDGTYVGIDSQTEWTCHECQEVVGVGDDFDGIVSMHQAHMVRLAIVGAS